MSNKNLFVSNQVSANTAKSVNLAGGKAYDLSAKEALAQFAACGTFNGTFYATPEKTMEQILGLLPKVDDEFVAKLAIYSREKAWLKDMPAFLTAYLSAKDVNLAKKVFPRTINGGVMVRNYAQMIRSGKLGRKSFGSAMKKAIEGWFDSQTDERIFAASIGNDPSLADVIKMVHPRPTTPARAALYAYLIGKEHDATALPEVVKNFEAYKKDQTLSVPDIDFRFLSSLNLSTEAWTRIMENASWRTARMNINTFKRHGVLNNQTNVDKLATKIADPKAIKYAKVFPYELLSAYIYMEDDVSLSSIKNALHDAMELSISNVPDFDNANIEIGVDVSGSMGWPITGHHTSAASKIRCIDVAALIASVIKRRGRNVGTYVFDNRCKEINIDGRDTVMTNVQKLAAVGGSTACSSFVAKLNEQKKESDIVFIISDNMSWAEYHTNRHGTVLKQEWNKYKARNPKAKLILLDIVPNTTTQAQSDSDVLNIAGWNDNMFQVILDFITGTSGKTAWIKEIESIEV